MLSINIDALTEAELVDLNHRVVARLRFLQEVHSHASMSFGSASGWRFPSRWRVIGDRRHYALQQENGEHSH